MQSIKTYHLVLLGLFGKKKSEKDDSANTGNNKEQNSQAPAARKAENNNKMTDEEIRKVEDHIYELLKQVIDPEIGLDIINLGLVYNIVYDGKKHIYVEMTLSTPACPLSDALVSNVKNIIEKYYPGYTVDVELTFDPPWDTSMISEEGKRFLGMIQ